MIYASYRDGIKTLRIWMIFHVIIGTIAVIVILIYYLQYIIGIWEL
jgi:hypothetical protein